MTTNTADANAEISSQRFKSDSVSEIRGAAFLEIAWLVPLLKLQSTLEISDLLGGKNLSSLNPELPFSSLNYSRIWI